MPYTHTQWNTGKCLRNFTKMENELFFRKKPTTLQPHLPHPFAFTFTRSLARSSLSRELYTQSTRKINVAWRVSSRRRKGGKQKERTFAFQYSFSHSLPYQQYFLFRWVASLLLYSFYLHFRCHFSIDFDHFYIHWFFYFKFFFYFYIKRNIFNYHWNKF